MAFFVIKQHYQKREVVFQQPHVDASAATDLTHRGADKMINVAINGYGRIGRNILRALYERSDLSGKMQVVAINDLGSAQMNAHLIQFDTTHARFSQSV